MHRLIVSAAAAAAASLNLEAERTLQRWAPPFRYTSRLLIDRIRPVIHIGQMTSSCYVLHADECRSAKVLNCYCNTNCIWDFITQAGFLG
jgi:hypothetical protein